MVIGRRFHSSTRRLRILTWHVHGSYLHSLVQAPHDFLLPVKPGRPEGYGARGGNFDWPDNVYEVPAEEVRELDFDLVVFQSRKNWCEDQHEILSDAQRRLPRIYLEHDPPLEHPTNTRHIVDDPEVLLVHVTHYNALMWDAGDVPTHVVEHAVMVPDAVRYTGELDRGIVVVNHIGRRGRRLGADVFEDARTRVPLDLAGMGSEEYGGLGDLPRERLLEVEARYRFFFHPIRYTSLGLAVCEAMMLGMPIVGLATTELPAVVEDGVSGYLSNDPAQLVERMERLLADPVLARRLGDGARRTAEARFNIDRFVRDWDATFKLVAARVEVTPRATAAMTGGLA